MVKGKIEPTDPLRRARPRCGRTKRPCRGDELARARARVRAAPEAVGRMRSRWEMIELQVADGARRARGLGSQSRGDSRAYRGNQEATSAVFLRLINLGLGPGRAGPESSRSNGPRHPDAGVLPQSIRARGSRPPAGELGVAATRGEIWTPDSTPAPADGAASWLTPIWTPGSAASLPAAGDGAKTEVDHRYRAID